MADSAQDRQLPATERKILKARREGQVARSRDLVHLIVFGGAVAAAMGLGHMILDPFLRLLVRGLSFDASVLAQTTSMSDRLWTQGLWATATAGLACGALALSSVLGGLLSGGWNLSLEPLAPKWEKLDPIAGLGRLVNPQQLGTALKASLLAVVIGGVGAAYLWSHLRDFAAVATLPLPAALALTGQLVGGGMLLLVLPLATFAAVDVPLQRWLLGRRLRMSHQEMKQEHKDVEGDVGVKAKIRLRMREMANRRMIAAVPSADLVVMNPTHFAVALRYDESEMSAPRIVAKGADLLALRIRDVARESGVPVLEAPPLARALYAHGEVDREIPVALFSAVAQVLAWVFRLRQAESRGQPAAVEPPQPQIPAGLDPAERR